LSCDDAGKGDSDNNAPACVDATWLHWLGDLVAVHGAGEYVVRVRVDGSVTVKRPRRPLEFDWKRG
jgi:hypothetical protein